MNWSEMLVRATKPSGRRTRQPQSGAIRRKRKATPTEKPLKAGLHSLSDSLRRLTEYRSAQPAAATLSQACGAISEDPTSAGLDRAALLGQIRRLRRENESLLVELREQSDQSSNQSHPPFHASAHDLKTPLCTLESVVDALLNSLNDDGISQEARNMARLVELASKRMRGLVDDILDLGRVGDHHDEKELVDLGQLVATAVERHSQTIEKQQISVRVAAPLPIVSGPRRDLTAVVTNIVENAVKYAPTDGRAHEICIGVDRSTPTPTFWISDTGCGFDPRKVEEVFETYARCNADVDGSGLGLAIVKKAVEGWGGQVWIETESDNGTTVYFTAPGGNSHAAAPSGSLWVTRQEDLR